MSVINLQKCYADTSVIELAFNFKATYWPDLKVDAIEPLSDFYWIEDSPIPEELVWLRQNGVLDRQIRVDSYDFNVHSRLFFNHLALSVNINTIYIH